MTFDELQKTWQSQQVVPKLVIDPDLLLKEIKRNKKCFESAILRRDVGEIGCAVLLIGVFLYFGIKDNLWPMWLLALLCLWVGVFMVTDRIVQKRKQPCLSDSLFDCVKSSLAQINHQVWLLRNVLWWYLLPLGAGLVIWFSYCGISVINENDDLSLGFLLFILTCIIGTILLYWGIYLLNQSAIRKQLTPRKHELEELLISLEKYRNKK